VACGGWPVAQGAAVDDAAGAGPALYVVLVGPGGAGKGAIARELVRRDPSLWLSRSWTTRPRRPGEPEDAYVFVDRPTFEARVRAGGVLEWAEFLGHCYGTPWPDPPPGSDVLLEIDLQGAKQVRERRPDALVVLIAPPSEQVQAERLRGRGESEETVRRRVEKGRQELAEGALLADAVVVNDVLERAVGEVAGIIGARRAAVRGGELGDEPSGS